MDFNASPVHRSQKESIVGHIVVKPNTASAVASAAYCTGKMLLLRRVGRLTWASGWADMTRNLANLLPTNKGYQVKNRLFIRFVDLSLLIDPWSNKLNWFALLRNTIESIE